VVKRHEEDDWRWDIHSQHNKLVQYVWSERLVLHSGQYAVRPRLRVGPNRRSITCM